VRRAACGAEAETLRRVLPPFSAIKRIPAGRARRGPERETDLKERFIEAGEIVNTHGVRGEVKISPWTDSAEFLMGFKTLYIDGKAVGVLSSRAHKGMLLARLAGVADLNAAMALKGKPVFIDRCDARLPEGAYFLQDLIGARVFTEDGAALGTLSEIIEAPAGNVYVVRGDAEHLIPAVPEFILSADADAGTVTVRLIEGM
jgi:16S rRNA processing protein RimM